MSSTPPEPPSKRPRHESIAEGGEGVDVAAADVSEKELVSTSNQDNTIDTVQQQSSNKNTIILEWVLPFLSIREDFPTFIQLCRECAYMAGASYQNRLRLPLQPLATLSPSNDDVAEERRMLDYSKIQSVLSEENDQNKKPAAHEKQTELQATSQPKTNTQDVLAWTPNVVQNPTPSSHKHNSCLDYRRVLTLLSTERKEQKPCWEDEEEDLKLRREETPFFEGYKFPETPQIQRKGAYISLASRTVNGMIVVVVSSISIPENERETNDTATTESTTAAATTAEAINAPSETTATGSVPVSETMAAAAEATNVAGDDVDDDEEPPRDLWLVLYKLGTPEAVLVQALVTRVDPLYANFNGKSYDSGSTPQGFGVAFASPNGQFLAVLTEVGGYETDSNTCTLSLYQIHSSQKGENEFCGNDDDNEDVKAKTENKQDVPMYSVEKVRDYLLGWRDLEYGTVDASFSTCGRLLSVRWTRSQYEAVSWSIFETTATSSSQEPPPALFEDRPITSEGALSDVKQLYFTADHEVIVELDAHYMTNRSSDGYAKEHLGFLAQTPRFCKRVVVVIC